MAKPCFWAYNQTLSSSALAKPTFRTWVDSGNREKRRSLQARREMFVEEQFHVGGNDTNFRSRSAAKTKQALISSGSKSGKSESICWSVMPEARYSRTSYTVIRSPRRQGFPPRFPGSIVIRSRYDMMPVYGSFSFWSIGRCDFVTSFPLPRLGRG